MKLNEAVAGLIAARQENEERAALGWDDYLPDADLTDEECAWLDVRWAQANKAAAAAFKRELGR